ncbi:APG7-like ubiquitin activating enzyme E1 [Cryptosporidium canis]|uniref:APG7-like ubiquitin activating enzyme E1 n=1 Tax=Cryptosporidium canis TaxID=195482 RepID=A0ABQ8PAE7_9CRYT|nr:APG7-like ubiquitin activating enzyme E1 [Cryptosporidium canis]KAJ1611044.1 APG7-like ubiquitin activating enzyme E1 [Cryptosporidium canis]
MAVGQVKASLSFGLPTLQIEVGFWKRASDLKYNILKSSEDSFEILGFYNHEANIIRVRQESLDVNDGEYSGYKNSVIGRLTLVNSMSAILHSNCSESERDSQLESTVECARKWLSDSSDDQSKYPFTFSICIYFDFKTQIAYYSALFPSIISDFSAEGCDFSKLGIRITSDTPGCSGRHINLDSIANNSTFGALIKTVKDKLYGYYDEITSTGGDGTTGGGIDCPWFLSTILCILLLEEKNNTRLDTLEALRLLKEPSFSGGFRFELKLCFITRNNVRITPTLCEQMINQVQSKHILLFDLKSYLTPHELQQRINTMNIDLIKWRLIPDFEQSRFNNLRFLLIGSGTLGCGVARNLIGWGIRNFTFIDHSKVSLNNPIRQCLFTIEDAKSRKNKAQAAVERLRYICPDIIAEGIDFEVPMLGDATRTPTEFLDLVNQTRNYIAESDVVMLLTDNKESRWIPTVLTALINRYQSRKRPVLCITVGLGFDSFIVVRNTFTETDDSTSGCYFCGDFSINSKNDILGIPIDQQCSVVRMGTSYFASSIAVELIMNLSQHPLMWNAPHSSDPPSMSKETSSENKSLLGTTPQCIRGFLGNFSFCKDPIQRNKYCIACSSELIDQIHKDEAAVLTQAFNNPRSVESISGLSYFKSQMEESVVESFD